MKDIRSAHRALPKQLPEANEERNIRSIERCFITWDAFPKVTGGKTHIISIKGGGDEGRGGRSRGCGLDTLSISQPSYYTLDLPHLVTGADDRRQYLLPGDSTFFSFEVLIFFLCIIYPDLGGRRRESLFGFSLVDFLNTRKRDEKF